MTNKDLADLIDHVIDDLVSSLDFCHPELRTFHINERKSILYEALRQQEQIKEEEE
ncbi:MAG TPA: hypothetical protein VJ044_19160 [Candidatus Hodarchaeales archaeon]|nr:hypothetical protein [Candidatus Hodarchaeales archaeon]